MSQLITDPLVSVILAVHNRQDCVARAISSVLAQTYSPLELIVIDDGSTDDTREVVKRFGGEVTLVSIPHSGVYVARNIGLQRAHGELIAFIDSDDYWFADKLTLQVPLMKRAAVGLVFGDLIHVLAAREDAEQTGLTCFRVSPPCSGRATKSLSRRNFVPTCSVLVRRSCLEEIGGFSETSELSADYLAWFRISLRHEFAYVNRAVGEYTVHSSGISFDLGRALVTRINLFSSELKHTTDPATRTLLRRLLFNLSLHLSLAVLFRRARNEHEPLKLAWRTARSSARFEAATWTAAFALDQLQVRTRRLLP
ncbi:MAG TPA: glycosyltransferase [Pyrinomonadaceae bacterium]|nr:glycosyltransferase [Pyrinomonadaceae bacterium]